eukprot:TRINITY_DN6020_c0_g1_i1.p1 TRINITY_DN6020_c0_g1~~TRINITY_DN6020_c0_g1_i1.p1  ORF type:complete len:213 (-),score=44.39 TRINITY_DN6020_c0_g1_i1:47-607(-)
MDDEPTEPQTGLAASCNRLLFAIKKRYQKILDDTVPYHKTRWIVALCVTVAYMLRVYYAGGFYIITYALGIYLLNLLIDFLSPLQDPEYDEFNIDDGELPVRTNDEYKPFIRKLPEFHFWYSSVSAVFGAFVCTFLEFLDIPVFWPILLIYFFVLFFVSIKNRVVHMIKHKYIPFSLGKPKFGGKK